MTFLQELAMASQVIKTWLTKKPYLLDIKTLT